MSRPIFILFACAALSWFYKDPDAAPRILALVFLYELQFTVHVYVAARIRPAPELSEAERRVLRKL